MTSLFENSFFLLVVRSGSKLITIFIVALLARELGPGNFGLYGSIITLVSFAAIIADFGLILPNIRSISRNDLTPGVLANEIASANIIWSLFGVIIVAGVGMFLNLPFFAVVLFAGSSILEIRATNMIRMYEGVNNFKVISAFVLFERTCFGVAVTISLYIFRSVTSISIGYAVCYTILLILSYRYFAKDFGPIRLKFTMEKFKQYSKIGLPFTTVFIFSAMFNRSDILLINSLRGHEESGLFNAVVRIFESQAFIPLTLISTVYPNLSNSYKESDLMFKREFLRALFFMALIGFIISAGVFSFSRQIIQLLFSSQYDGSIPLLHSLSFMFIFYYVNAILSYTLFAMHKEKVYAVVIINLALLNILLNWISIPEHGAAASVSIRIVGEILLTAVLGSIIVKEIWWKAHIS